MGQLYGEGHQLRRLIAGKAEHQPLVAGTARIYPHSYVRRLPVDGREDATGITVESVLRACITNPSNGFTCHLREIDMRVRRDLPGEHNQTGGDERLTGDAPGLILPEHFVQHCVRDLICDLVGMAFRH